MWGFVQVVMFALCVENRGCEDLEKRKIYQFYYLHLPPEAEVALQLTE